MPARGTTTVMNGKKTLSDSEVLAYSKNRFVEYKLRRKVRELKDQEQMCHDKHQQEIFRWKHFMRQSTKHSGVWLLDIDGEDGSGGEESPEAGRSSVLRMDAGSRADDSAGKTLQRGNPSTELARSLAFRSEALSQLQKPWAYTYSTASHNTVYKEALELTQMKKRRLYLRRTLSASLSPADVNGRSFSRNRSTEGENLHDSRPFTARSMPATLQGGKPRSDSRDGSTAVKSRRPKTSVGIVRTTQKRAKAALSSGDVDQNGSRCVKTDRGLTAELPVSGAEQKEEPVSDNVEDNVITAFVDIVGDRGSHGLVPTEQKNENKGKFPILVGKHTPDVKESITANEDQTDMSVMNGPSKKQGNDGDANSSEAEARESQSTRQLLPGNPARRPQKSSTKRVHIVLSEEHLPANDNDPECNTTSPQGSAEPSQSPGKEETERSEGAEGITPLALKVAAAMTADSDQPNHQPEVKTDKDLKTVVSKLVTIREFQSKSAGAVRRRSQLANLGRRRQSFLDIADQLEALRSNNGRRQLLAGDERDDDDNPIEASKSPNEASALDNSRTSDAKDSSSKPPVTSSKEKPTIEAKLIAHQQTKANSNVDRTEIIPQTSKPTMTSAVNRPPETQTPQPEKTTDPVTNDPAFQPPLELDEDYDAVDFFPSDRCSFAGSDCTEFKGYRIRNYIRPQLRYLGDPFLNSRRERSLIRLSIEHPIYLNGSRGDIKSDMLFPKTCRQKVLQELVHRNNQPPPVHDAGVVPPELRAKIDEFFKTIEPFCLKPEEGIPD